MLVLGFAVIVGWLSLPLLWYPKFEELNYEKLTIEADVVLATCGQGASKSNGESVSIIEHATPYIYSLVEGEDGATCAEGLQLLLWDDKWATTAGLYIVREQNEIPDWLASFATLLEGRVYKWHTTE